MRKAELIHNAYSVNTANEMTDTLSNFSGVGLEIAAVVACWLNNGYIGENYALKKILFSEMKGDPLSYVVERKYLKGERCELLSICGIMTLGNFHALMDKVWDAISFHGTVFYKFSDIMDNVKKYGCKYVHEALSIMFSGDTGFPTHCSTSPFYRLNLLYYTLAYNMNVWDRRYGDRFVLPMNDCIADKAYHTGITDERLKSTLTSAVTLTEKARKWFGCDDFYKMYELLAFSEL